MTKSAQEKSTKSTIRKIFSAIGYVLFAFVFLCLVLVIVQFAMHKEPSLFGLRLYTVQTDSMLPSIEKGDVLICKDTDTKYDYKVGEIITFVAPDGFSNSAIVGKNVTHRVLKAPFQNADGKWVVTTKGDNNSAPDNVDIPLENIRGVVVTNSAPIRGLVNFIGKWYGFVLVIILPLFVILVVQIVNIVKAKSQAEKERMDKEKKLAIELAIKDINAQLAQDNVGKNNVGGDNINNDNNAAIELAVKNLSVELSLDNDDGDENAAVELVVNDIKEHLAQEKAENAEKAEKAENAEKAEKAENAENAEKAENAENADIEEK